MMMEVLKVVAASQVMGYIICTAIIAGAFVVIVLGVTFRMTRDEDNRIKASRWDELQRNAVHGTQVAPRPYPPTLEG